MSPLFEELGDALAPGKAALDALKRELESRRSRWEREGYAYRGAGDFILQHGQFWTGRPLPDLWASSRGGLNRCFLNALEAAAQSNGALQYVEGVYSTGEGHFTPHAWCYDGEGVIEVTYPTDVNPDSRNSRGQSILPPEHWGYAGVVFPTLDYLWAHRDKYGFPMFDRPGADQMAAAYFDMSEPHDWPILKLPFDPTRKELP